MPKLDSRTTALVLIDLQKGITGRDLAPRSAEEAIAVSKALAERFRSAGALVVLVNVAFADDYADAPPANVDQPMPLPPGGLPKGFADLVDGLAKASDLRITKRNWGAFHGTDLDLHLRRRGIRTIVLGGVATNFGVESTAREAWQHGYDVVVAEDATASMTAELHEVAVKHILPRISRVRPSAEIELEAGAR